LRELFREEVTALHRMATHVVAPRAPKSQWSAFCFVPAAQAARADLAAGRRIACPVLALWSGAGSLGSWYEAEGGPLALWRPWCNDVRGHPVQGGHFFPEEFPQQTAEALARFFAQ